MTEKAILILGGYGTFGGRLVRLLEDEPRLTLIVAGRSRAKAEAFCKSRGSVRAKLIAEAFDRDGDIAAQLAAHKIDLLVDASGPFQAYGEGQYRVVEACIARKINYADLADGSDFVAGIRAYDEVARDAGLFVLGGVSSFPVLTAAVVRALSGFMIDVDHIRGGIAPSPFAGVGLNVIRAIAGYSGQSISLKRNGKIVEGFPLTEQMRFTVRPPGIVPLRNTLFSLVDVPDLRALSKLWPEAQTIWMGAGPVPEILHRALIGLAWLVRWRLIATLTPLAPLMHFATNHLRWGEHRGGMFVEVDGRDVSGKRLKRSWHMLAEGDDGPLIPSMAVEAIVRKWLEESAPVSGARAAIRDLELQDYEKLFATRQIHTGARDDARDGQASLYAQILGSAWEVLPAEIRAVHDDVVEAKGRASVIRGTNPLARLAASLIRFPQASADTEVSVHFDRSANSETWTRQFGDDRFSSRHFAGTGRAEGLVCERFGPLTFAMALVAEGEKLALVLRRWSLFSLPLPMWLCPRSRSYEFSEDGKFHFHVEISHPLTGLIVRYQGWLEPQDKTAK